MTFEEKYAAQGRKLDELKAKLDAAIDARKLAHEQKCEELITAAFSKYPALISREESTVASAKVEQAPYRPKYGFPNPSKP